MSVARGAALDEVLANDHHGHAGGAGVLLGTGVDEAVALDVERHGQEAARDVSHEGRRPAVGQLVELRAEDRVVLADVDVVRSPAAARSFTGVRSGMRSKFVSSLLARTSAWPYLHPSFQASLEKLPLTT